MMTEISIKPAPPYDFDLSFRFMGPSNPDPAVIFKNETLWQLVVLDDNRELIAQVRSIGTCERPELVLTIDGDSYSDSDIRLAESQIKRMLCLDLDLEDFYTSIESDPVLHSYCLNNLGLKPVIDASPFEALTWAIIGQQVNLRFACQVKLGMLERYGRIIRYNNETFYRYPDPSDLAYLDPEMWKEFKSSRRKAEYIIGLSRHIVEGFDLNKLANLPDDEIKEQLINIRGIGNWTAEYVLIQGFGHWNALPIGDAGLQNGFRKLYGLDRKPTHEELVKQAEHWKPYRGLATYYIWWGKISE